MAAHAGERCTPQSAQRRLHSQYTCPGLYFVGCSNKPGVQPCPLQVDERKAAIQSFADTGLSRPPLLVCTDLAARWGDGLQFSDV